MNENKYERFKRVASKRVSKILYYLGLLGNCSNRSVYAYTDEEVKKIFSAIENELKRVKALFKKGKKEFRL